MNRPPWPINTGPFHQRSHQQAAAAAAAATTADMFELLQKIPTTTVRQLQTIHIGYIPSTVSEEKKKKKTTTHSTTSTTIIAATPLIPHLNHVGIKRSRESETIKSPKRVCWEQNPEKVRNFDPDEQILDDFDAMISLWNYEDQLETPQLPVKHILKRKPTHVMTREEAAREYPIMVECYDRLLEAWNDEKICNVEAIGSMREMTDYQKFLEEKNDWYKHTREEELKIYQNLLVQKEEEFQRILSQKEQEFQAKMEEQRTSLQSTPIPVDTPSCNGRKLRPRSKQGRVIYK